MYYNIQNDVINQSKIYGLG